MPQRTQRQVQVQHLIMFALQVKKKRAQVRLRRQRRLESLTGHEFNSSDENGDSSFSGTASILILTYLDYNRNSKCHINHWFSVIWKPRSLASVLVRICLLLVGNLLPHTLVPHISDLDSEDEFDDGADWLNGDRSLPAGFETVEKISFMLAGCDSIDLRSLYLRELLSESSAKQASQPVSAPMKKVRSLSHIRET
ncbi:hypothetical protein BDR07DRAFT_1387918 [Suillus spraguei]|nr:hypothetical protein BDR07DRAFT_1387918 [Suillus spraguei]